MYDYLWHIHIDGNKMLLSMFKDLCQNVLKLLGNRIVSLSITFTNIIGGWSLISSSLKYYKTMSLRRLHLIDIQPYEFDKLLNNCVIKQIHTLLINVSESNPFTNQVCSCFPGLTNCRLPFNFRPRHRKQLAKFSVSPLMTLPNSSNPNHLHSLVLGINTSNFLQHLLECIPFIKNLSFGIQDEEINDEKNFDIHKLPAPVDARLLRHLSRLKLNCINTISFHKTSALLLSVFGQLAHLSLILKADSLVSDPLIISGDTIQQLCIDRLNLLATFTLNLKLTINNDMKDKVIFNSFVKAPFTNRQQPKVFIQNYFSVNNSYDTYCFDVYTLPCSDTELGKSIIAEYLQKSGQMSSKGIDLFLRSDELFIISNHNNEFLTVLGNCGSSLSSLVPLAIT
ncbi:unnamed protein product, partial [Rotaria sp. Silwood1]